MTRRVVYICDWLPPDFGAIGQYALLQARETAAVGKAVVLGGLSSSADSVSEEDHGSGQLKVRRFGIRSCDKRNIPRRLLWTIQANTLLIRRLWGDLRRCEEIRFTGSPPFILHFVWAVNLLLRKRLVYRIADFHPECLMARMNRVPVSLKIFQRLTVLLRRRVDRIEAIGEDQRRRLLAQGIARDRIEVVRYRSPVEIGAGMLPLPRPAELDGYVTLLYSGNWGLAHEYRTFLDGYRRHHEHGCARIGLWLNAIGQLADVVEGELREAQLPVARSHPVPLKQLANLMVTPEAHLITLRDSFVGYVVPSKVYACIDSGAPILFIGSTESDVDLLCREALPADRYEQADCGDPDAVFNALERLAAGYSFAAEGPSSWHRSAPAM